MVENHLYYRYSVVLEVNLFSVDQLMPHGTWWCQQFCVFLLHELIFRRSSYLWNQQRPRTHVTIRHRRAWQIWQRSVLVGHDQWWQYTMQVQHRPKILPVYRYGFGILRLDETFETMKTGWNTLGEAYWNKFLAPLHVVPIKLWSPALTDPTGTYTENHFEVELPLSVYWNVFVYVWIKHNRSL